MTKRNRSDNKDYDKTRPVFLVSYDEEIDRDNPHRPA